ncbi:MAG: hypothetical protein K8F92_15525 [Hyphomicrobium sp.]|uniref:hypothetical protein n=1 Tax=Hyphomicrobium sp. TaxID=82 RepID=UPI001321EA85|nr:hypothetical protein [Hyphomicrobium sp.]KAB2937994.1 MAG: hypothetical protein F9K20_19265 [Hyphomicrobium sp.]MBZ0211040.1 hypothetical protein [Hyphomicrobium sp.]
MFFLRVALGKQASYLLDQQPILVNVIEQQGVVLEHFAHAASDYPKREFFLEFIDPLWREIRRKEVDWQRSPPWLELQFVQLIVAEVFPLHCVQAKAHEEHCAPNARVSNIRRLSDVNIDLLPHLGPLTAACRELPPSPNARITAPSVSALSTTRLRGSRATTSSPTDSLGNHSIGPTLSGFRTIGRATTGNLIATDRS